MSDETQKTNWRARLAESAAEAGLEAMQGTDGWHLVDRETGDRITGPGGLGSPALACAWVEGWLAHARQE